ncbi:MAG: DUF4267 domain-containing protein [Pseudomonadota bacterium]
MQRIYTSTGFWLALLMALSQALNAFRAFTDPVGFAAYLGLPLVDVQDIGFVHVYGLRALFIALLVGLFLWQKDLRAVQWTAVAALVMPLGDVLLTVNAGASTGTVVRHVLIAVVVGATALLIWRWRRAQA